MIDDQLDESDDWSASKGIVVAVLASLGIWALIWIGLLSQCFGGGT